eukprot:3814815-Alexandrium_andersonii.AAC.1
MVAAPWWSAPETVLLLATQIVCLRILAGCPGHGERECALPICEHGVRDQGRTITVSACAARGRHLNVWSTMGRARRAAAYGFPGARGAGRREPCEYMHTAARQAEGSRSGRTGRRSAPE